MRRRFDDRHQPHSRYRQPHHRQHASPDRRPVRPTRVRSFHEDELRRNRIEPPSAVTADCGPKIVGTLLKPEYQRKPGLDEEIRLLPPPPRRRSASTSSGGDDTTPAPSPSPRSTPRRPTPPERPTPTRTPFAASSPHQQQQQQQRTAIRGVDTVAVWSAVSNASKTTALAEAVDFSLPLRRAMTQKLIRKRTLTMGTGKGRCATLARHGSNQDLTSHKQQQKRLAGPPQRSNNASRSSVMIRNSYRHGRIIQLEQKATKVLGVVFFTFVFLWTPFFALNLLPSVCPNCEANTNKGLIDLVTWLGYASSMVNPIFYTIFNKVFREAFKRVLMCKYRGRSKRYSWPPQPTVRKL